ncbi:MAG: RNA ligase family protein [Solirubrobacterales bacterium]|nr:RNA ligase family protein [Solirubrobacterales bacterium]
MKLLMKYPPIPHLLSAPGRGDRILSPSQRQALLSTLVIVEEKLDGANVSIWFEGPETRIATRGGPDAMDRGGILGRVRQWTYQRIDELRAALGQDLVLYGEWLLMRHGITYTQLPAPLVAFDLLDRDTRSFVPIDRRDALLKSAGLWAPPRLFTGRLETADTARCLIRRSAFGEQDAEGIIIRAIRPNRQTPRIAKLVRADFCQIRGAGANASENTVLSR